MHIPAHNQYLGADDLAALTSVFNDGLLAGNGVVCQRVQNYLKQMLQVEQVLLTTSSGRALDLAMQVLAIGRNDEVIVPSFASAETANCVALRGATPVFADIDPTTLNIDPHQIERHITSFTKAIIVYHYAGNAAPMNSIVELAAKHNLYVVENAADAIDAQYKKCQLGTIGHVGCYSFASTKNISCGEGGAFVTNDPLLAARAKRLHFNNQRAPITPGRIGQESWQALGSSYALPDLQAAILESQLAKRADIKRKRKAVWQSYFEALQPLVSAELISLPQLSPNIDPNYHLFYFVVSNASLRNRLVCELHKYGIMASAHYVPLHRSHYGKRFSSALSLPVSDKISRSIVCLPIYPSLTERAATFIVKAVKSVFVKLLDSQLPHSAE